VAALLIVVLKGIDVMMGPRMPLRERLGKLIKPIVARMLLKILVIIVAMLLLTESRTRLISGLDIGFFIIFWINDLELLITLIIDVQLDE
jgi:hypothetical protein